MPCPTRVRQRSRQQQMAGWLAGWHVVCVLFEAPGKVWRRKKVAPRGIDQRVHAKLWGHPPPKRADPQQAWHVIGVGLLSSSNVRGGQLEMFRDLLVLMICRLRVHEREQKRRGKKRKKKRKKGRAGEKTERERQRKDTKRREQRQRKKEEERGREREFRISIQYGIQINACQSRQMGVIACLNAAPKRQTGLNLFLESWICSIAVRK